MGIHGGFGLSKNQSENSKIRKRDRYIQRYAPYCPPARVPRRKMSHLRFFWRRFRPLRRTNRGFAPAPHHLLKKVDENFIAPHLSPSKFFNPHKGPWRLMNAREVFACLMRLGTPAGQKMADRVGATVKTGCRQGGAGWLWTPKREAGSRDSVLVILPSILPQIPQARSTGFRAGNMSARWRRKYALHGR